MSESEPMNENEDPGVVAAEARIHELEARVQELVNDLSEQSKERARDEERIADLEREAQEKEHVIAGLYRSMDTPREVRPEEVSIDCALAALRAQASTPDFAERFTYHPPSQGGIDRHAALAAGFEGLAGLVNELVLDGREKSVALTKLEEGKFWASAGVARNPATR